MICQQCGQEHPIDEVELTFLRPDVIAEMNSEQREQTVQEQDDLCAIKGSRYFVRSVLPLPVESRDQPYSIGLWVEVEWPTFRRILDLWSEPGQASEPPFNALVANAIPNLPSTLGLAAKLHLTGPTTRPKVYLEPQEHPLVTEQTRGISLHRAHEYTLLCA